MTRRLALALVLTAVAGLGAITGPDGVAGATGDTSRFEPVTPCRVLDTRTAAALAPGADVRVEVAGRCGVPSDATAVALTVTGAGASRDGYLTIWPSDRGRPDASNLNLAAGETRANSAIVRLGGGSIEVHADAGGHVLVDVTGAFVPADASDRGRFEPIEPQRLVDSRGAGRPAPGSSVPVALPAGVPTDATAVAINVTTADSVGAGYFTAYASGGPVPEASVLNTDGPGQTRAASAIVPVGPAGFEIFTSAGDHVIVDATGYFTGTSAPVTDIGLFVPADPSRSLDTRPVAEVLPGGHAMFDHWSGGRFAHLVGNVTMIVLPGEPGFATLRAPNPTLDCGDDVSSVNADAGAVANGFVGLAVDDLGEGWVRTSTFANLLVDVSGGFVGTPAPHRPDWLPTFGDAPVDPGPDPGGTDHHPEGPSDPWARQWAESCLPPSVLARLDAIDTRWYSMPGSGGRATFVWGPFGQFYWIELGTSVPPEPLCNQVVPHEAMHVLDYATGFPSTYLHQFLGPLNDWQQAECLAQAAEIMIVGDRRLGYDFDDGIRTCTRSVYAADLAHVLWHRVDGVYFRWSGDAVVPA